LPKEQKMREVQTAETVEETIVVETVEEEIQIQTQTIEIKAEITEGDNKWQEMR
jgi:hypothetical protein